MLAAATSSDSQHGSFSFLGWLRDCILLINMYSPMRYVKRKNACGTSIKPKILRILSFCLNLFAHSFVRSVILCVFFYIQTHTHSHSHSNSHIYIQRHPKHIKRVNNSGAISENARSWNTQNLWMFRFIMANKWALHIFSVYSIH